MATRTTILAIFGTVGFAIGFLAFLASPLTAAASAVNGVVSDPRALPGIESLAAVGGR